VTVTNPPTGGVSKLAATPAAGYALQNGTGPILTWTAPNDGNLHAAQINLVLIVTSAETGGQVTISFTVGGQAKANTVAAAGGGIGVFPENPYTFTCDPGTTVTLAQASALTAGAASIYAALLGL
jgi:hypothetical protein